jgi:ubiquinone/menaquinone biosynthesis C-methylase UbiE
MNKNRQIYESQKVVRNYKGLNILFPAEKKVYEVIKNKQNNKAMLDLGIGAGRTTSFFRPLFSHYTGIDFSENMINACRKRFTALANTEFINADVTSMPELSVEKFDFILFSLNGIDYLQNLEERKSLLSKLYELLDNNGLFVFSSHNTKALPKLYSFQLPKRNPFKLIPEYFRYRNLKKVNGSLIQFLNKEFCQLYDGGEYFNALTSYILPSFQVRLLEDSGFKNIQAIDIKGSNIPLDKIDSCHDDWIHYLCCKR